MFVVYRYYQGFRLMQKRSDAAGTTWDAWFVSPQAGLGLSGVYYASGTLFPATHSLVQSNVFDSVQREISIFRNGVRVATLRGVAITMPNVDALYIGKRDFATSTEGHLQGEIAELIIYNRTLTEDERRHVETYLQEKYRL